MTLSDVARRAGVSPATASRVINDAPYYVAPELRGRVLNAVAELQYVPNAHAKALLWASNRTIGVMVHDVSDPYFAEITRGLQRRAADANYLSIICNSYRDHERELAYLHMLRAQRVDAIVLAASGYHESGINDLMSEQLEAFVAQGGRLSVIGRRGGAGSALLPPNYDGAAKLASLLTRLGHRRFAIIAGPPELTTSADRLRGVLDVLRRRRIRVRDELILHSDHSRNGGYASMTELHRRDDSVTAVVACNDAMAVGALAACRDLGLSVPTDLSVVGFGDIPAAQDVCPSLTTLHLPLVEMGARAFELAFQHPETSIESVPGRVVIRSSTAPPTSP